MPFLRRHAKVLTFQPNASRLPSLLAALYCFSLSPAVFAQPFVDSPYATTQPPGAEVSVDDSITVRRLEEVVAPSASVIEGSLFEGSVVEAGAAYEVDIEDPKAPPIIEDITDLLLDSQPYDMVVQSNPDDQSASLFINQQEVVKLRYELGGISPEIRMKLVKDRLNRFLAEGDPVDIKPGEHQGEVVIKMGDNVLLTVSDSMAEALELKPEDLAFVWTNQIRQSLGEEPLSKSESIATAAPIPAAWSIPTVKKHIKPVMPVISNPSGMASWYGVPFHGRRTASGEPYNMYAYTAAHKTLPFHTRVKVTNMHNGKSVVVRINDRGPYAHGRVLDLSKQAASEIGLLRSGTAPIKMEVVE